MLLLLTSVMWCSSSHLCVSCQASEEGDSALHASRLNQKLAMLGTLREAY